MPAGVDDKMAESRYHQLHRCFWRMLVTTYQNCRRHKVTNVTLDGITFVRKLSPKLFVTNVRRQYRIFSIRKLFENCPWQKQLERELIRKVSLSDFCKKFYFRSKSFLKNLISSSVWLHYKEKFWWITWLKYFNLLMYFFEKPNKKSKIKRILAR